MMVGVKESQLLLLYHQEYSINEFTKFGQIVEVVKTNKRLSPSILVTDSIEKTMVINHRNQLFSHKDQKSEGQCGKEKVMDLKKTIQDKWLDLELFENEITTKDDQVIGQNGHDYWWEGRKWEFTSNKCKL